MGTQDVIFTDLDHIRGVCFRSREDLSSQNAGAFRPERSEGMVGTSGRLLEVLNLVRTVAPTGRAPAGFFLGKAGPLPCLILP